MPRDPVAAQMDSLEFKNMEGMMYEAAAQGSKQVREESIREAMVDEAAAQFFSTSSGRRRPVQDWRRTRPRRSTAS